MLPRSALIFTSRTTRSISTSSLRSTTAAVLAPPTSITRPRPYSSAIMTSKSTTSAAASSGSDSRSAKVVSTSPLEDTDARWIKLKKIDWIDPEGRERKWEAADRTTRKGPVDAVAICAIIHRPCWSSPHILLISQFRPPCASSVIEMPAGLVDAEDSKAGEDENAGIVRAAVRELREETGYGEHQSGTKMDVVETSTVMMNDPGLTGANMKLCLFHIQVADDAPDPIAEPEEGEHIERHLVPLKGLYASLKEFQSQGYHVDARLAHFAIGLEVASGGLGLPQS